MNALTRSLQRNCTVRTLTAACGHKRTVPAYCGRSRKIPSVAAVLTIILVSLTHTSRAMLVYTNSDSVPQDGAAGSGGQAVPQDNQLLLSEEGDILQQQPPMFSNDESLHNEDAVQLYENNNNEKRSVVYGFVPQDMQQPPQKQGDIFSSSLKSSSPSQDYYYQQPSILNPLEVVSFQLMEDNDKSQNPAAGLSSSSNNNKNMDEIAYLNRNRYDWAGKNQNGGRRRNNQLPLLSRGERETDYDDFLDGEKVPSCRELKKMWRLARKIHQKALETNEIPRSSHPFSRFHSDRVRSSRRFRDRQKINVSPAEKSGEQSQDLSGDKEEEIFGTVSYTPGETVKRPLDSNLQEVISKLRGRPLSQEKDRGAWNTGIRYMAPEQSAEDQSPLSRLEDNLRAVNGLGPRRNKQFNNGRDDNSNNWGTIRYFETEKPRSKFDELRAFTKGGSMRGYRDTTGSSLSFPSTQSSSTSFDDSAQFNQRRKSLRKGSRSHRKKLKQRRRNKENKKNKKYRITKFHKNLMLKAK